MIATIPRDRGEDRQRSWARSGEIVATSTHECAHDRARSTPRSVVIMGTCSGERGHDRGGYTGGSARMLPRGLEVAALTRASTCAHSLPMSRWVTEWVPLVAQVCSHPRPWIERFIGKDRALHRQIGSCASPKMYAVVFGGDRDVLAGWSRHSPDHDRMHGGPARVTPKRVARDPRRS